MIEIGARARRLPAPPTVVFGSLTQPHLAGARPWLDLREDEVEPVVVRADRPTHVVWSSLWPERPGDEIHLELTAAGSETLLRFVLLTPAETPEPSELGHLRRRLNELFFADLRYSYGQ